MTPTVHLLLASLGLLLGPAMGALGIERRETRSLFDGLAMTLVGGLCLFLVLPHVLSELGLLGALLAVLGAAVPSLCAGLARKRAWSLTAFSVFATLHLVLDGALLGLEEAHMAWAIIAHRLPIGFTLLIAFRDAPHPRAATWRAAFLMIGATCVGFLLGPGLVDALPSAAPAALEALVAGSLLRILGAGRLAAPAHDHCHHDDHHHHRPRRSIEETWGAGGAVLGLVALAAIVVNLGALGPDTVPGRAGRTFLHLLLESAPALVLGYGLAGALTVGLTTKHLGRLGRGGRLGQALKGVVFGLPLPVCSCGVLPLYESFVRRGVPAAAALAFFVATPELGFDAVLLSIPLLGWPLTLARIVSAFVVAVTVGLMLSGGTFSTAPSTEAPPEEEVRPLGERVRAALRFGFGEVFDHTMPWILLGLLVAALIEPLLSAETLRGVPSFLQIPVAALISVPVYVCASGATPLAAVALQKGVSGGAVVALLIAGPATNITTFGVLTRLHGARRALAFGVAVTGLAILAGGVVDALGVGLGPLPPLRLEEEPHASPLQWLCLVALAGLASLSLFRQGPRGVLQQILQPVHSH
ncbi:MAG: permease [Myxococcota bacterium]